MDGLRKKSIPKIYEWELQKLRKVHVSYDDKIIIAHFDRMASTSKRFKKDDFSQLNRFIIPKEAYYKKNEMVVNTINYFIEYFDHDDELMMSYLYIKLMIDNKEKKLSKKKFINMLYNVFFTKSMQEKIVAMVDHNFIEHIKPSTKKRYSENLEFTNEHSKLLMKISTSIKLIVPIVFHFINSINADKKNLVDFYEELLFMYSDEINIYNKLREMVSNAIRSSISGNPLLWQQREVFGVDYITQTKESVNYVISDLIFRYAFDENLVAFNLVVMREKTTFFLQDQYDYNRSELSTSKGADGLSGVDKLEMNSFKIDESLPILSEINIRDTVKMISKNFGVKITDDELNYYKEHHVISKFQTQLLQYFYAKHFNGHNDLLLVKRDQYIKLMVILRKSLEAQGFVYMPDIITGNIFKFNKRIKNNRKFLDKLKDSAFYKQLINDKFSTLTELGKDDVVVSILSTILNSEFTVVDYESQDQLGVKIDIDNVDIMCDEFLRFLSQI